MFCFLLIERYLKEIEIKKFFSSKNEKSLLLRRLLLAHLSIELWGGTHRGTINVSHPVINHRCCQHHNRRTDNCLFVCSLNHGKSHLVFENTYLVSVQTLLFKSLQYIFLCQLSSPIITIYCRPLLTPLTLTLLGNHIDLEKNVCTPTRYVFPKTKSDINFPWFDINIQ